MEPEYAGSDSGTGSEGAKTGFTWNQVGIEQKQAAITEEMKRMRQLPLNSRHAAHRLRLLEKFNSYYPFREPCHRMRSWSCFSLGFTCDTALLVSLAPTRDPVARVFAWRVLELKDQGVSEAEAIAVADMEYRTERKDKKKAYSRLKQIARLQGKRPPLNPYLSDVKEIQAEENKFVRDRFNNPATLEIVNQLRQDRAQEMMDTRGGSFGK